MRMSPITADPTMGLDAASLAQLRALGLMPDATGTSPGWSARRRLGSIVALAFVAWLALAGAGVAVVHGTQAVIASRTA